MLWRQSMKPCECGHDMRLNEQVERSTSSYIKIFHVIALAEILILRAWERKCLVCLLCIVVPAQKSSFVNFSVWFFGFCKLLLV